MGNFQTGFSMLMPVLTLLLGYLMNRQIPLIWKSTESEHNPIRKIFGQGIIVFVIVMVIVGIGSLFIVGMFVIGIPDLPTSEPVNVSININSTNCVANISNIECTPTFSCEKFCPYQNITPPPVNLTVPQSCNNAYNITLYRPLILTLPRMGRGNHFN